MIDKIIRYRKLFLFISIAFIVVGITVFNIIPKQESPKLSIPYSILTVEAPGLKSNEVDEVILDLKDDILSIENLDFVESNAFDNYGLVIVGFDLDVSNAQELNNELYKVVANTNLGDNVKININNNFDEADILYAFAIDQLDSIYKLETELQKVDEISYVQISKTAKNQIVITFDNNKLVQNQINFTDVIKLIAANNSDYVLGYVNDSPIISINNVTSIEELNNLVVGSNGTTPLLLGNVANITESQTVNYSNQLNGNDIYYLSIYFDNKVDITELGDEVRSITDDYEVHEVSFSPDSVNATINDINTNLVAGIILVFIVVSIGLGLRSALSILITFPLTIFATISFLFLFNYELQMVSVAGLIVSIGIIVDNAIVVIDSINYNYSNGNSMDYSILKSIKVNAFPMLTSTLTTIMAFVPLMFLPGVGGQMAFTLPLTVIIALIISYFSAIFVVPIIGNYLIKDQQKPVKKHKYSLIDLISKAIKYPKTIIICATGLFIIAMTTLIVLQPIELFPTAEKDYVYIDYTYNESNDLTDLKEIESQIINNIDEDLDVISAINYTIPSFYNTFPANIASPNSGRIVFLNDQNNAETIATLNDNLTAQFGNELIFNVGELELNNPGAPIQLNLYNTDDYDKLYEELLALEQVAKIQTNQVGNKTDYQLEFNEQALLANQLSKGQVVEQLAGVINGAYVDIYNGDDYDDNAYITTTLQDPNQLLNQQIIINDETYVVSSLASLVEQESLVSINRYNFREYVKLNIEIDDQAGVYSSQNNIEEVLDKYNSDYVITGEVSLTQEMFTNVFYSGIVAFFIIFIILLFQFNKYSNAIIILITVPLSYIGSALLLIIANQPITFTVTLGLVTLMGIVVNNGILLIDYIENSNKKQVYAKCIEALTLRNRAILISNITTIIGLLPLIFFGNDFFRPMAIALVGGLIFGVILSLLLVPSLYIVFHKKTR